MTLDLDAIVELWRATLDPAPALVARTLAAHASDDEEWPEDVWRARAASPGGHEPALMRAFDFVKLPAARVLERLAVMESWRPHPVVTHWLVETFARQTRAPAMDGQKCFRRIFNLLVTHLDHEGAARFRSWLGTHRERVRATEYGAKFFDEGMQRVLDKSAARLAAARALTEAERATLETFPAPVTPPAAAEPTHEALLAAVYENPQEDAPRMVLADYLQQRDDPRGEFIALDLVASPSREQKRRRAALLKEHGKAWFPEALQRVVNRDAVYERGFLGRGTLVATDRVPVELSTFRELEYRVDSRHGPVDLDHPAFRGIETWRGLPFYSDALARCGPQVGVTRLGVVAGFRTPVGEIVAAVRPDTWPAMTELIVDVSRLEDCLVDGVPDWFDALATQLAARHPRLQRLSLAGIATYRRDGDTFGLIELVLPRTVTYELTWNVDLPHILAARARWFAWLDRQSVPIGVENRAAELGACLPPSAASRIESVQR